MSPGQPLPSPRDYAGQLRRSNRELRRVIFPTHTLVRRRVVSHLHETLTEWQSKHVRGQVMRGTPADFEHIRTVLASYSGHLRHANSHRLQRRLHRQFPWICAAERPRRFSHRLRGRHVTIKVRR